MAGGLAPLGPPPNLESREARVKDDTGKHQCHPIFTPGVFLQGGLQLSRYFAPWAIGGRSPGGRHAAGETFLVDRDSVSPGFARVGGLQHDASDPLSASSPETLKNFAGFSVKEAVEWRDLQL